MLKAPYVDKHVAKGGGTNHLMEKFFKNIFDVRNFQGGGYVKEKVPENSKWGVVNLMDNPSKGEG